MHTRLFTTATSISLAAGMLLTGDMDHALAEEHNNGAEHCVALSSIDRTEVVSDSGILFFMRNGDVYLNRLPHRCPGLAVEDAFMYRTSIGQLCDLDIISVLDDRGFGFTPGISCGLGMFEPVSADEAEALESGETEVADH